MGLRSWGISAVSALLVFGLTDPAAHAASAVQATDPNANSPAGVIYSIPLDTARQDAAPHKRSGGPGGTGGGGGTGGAGGSGGAGGGGNGGSGSGGSGASGGGASGGSASAGGAGAQAAGGQSGTGAGGAKGSAAGGASGSSLPSGATASGASPVLIPGGQPGSLIHSSNGFGSSSSVPGVSQPPSAGLGAVQKDANNAPLLAGLLSLLIIPAGLLTGRRAWRSSLRRTGESVVEGQ